MEGIRYVPLEFLNVAGAGEATEVTGRVFTAARVAAALELPPARLYELAWLVGASAHVALFQKMLND
jgi:hypothetical protein